jgi:hypothetical protein
MRRKRLNPEIWINNMTSNETWNDCPRCGKSWKDAVPTPGLIHRTRYCDECKEVMKDEVFGHMHERKPN